MAFKGNSGKALGWPPKPCCASVVPRQNSSKHIPMVQAVENLKVLFWRIVGKGTVLQKPVKSLLRGVRCICFGFQSN
jgi:hypothetical protein